MSNIVLFLDWAGNDVPILDWWVILSIFLTGWVVSLFLTGWVIMSLLTGLCNDFLFGDLLRVSQVPAGVSVAGVTVRAVPTPSRQLGTLLDGGKKAHEVITFLALVTSNES